MTLVKHELRQGWKFLAIWTAAISFFVVICIFMYPEMKGEMQSASAIFASMGAFTAAFGMDRLNFGTLIGFYAIECGNILSIGGALFAALVAVGALANEERDHTAEFLLTHPVSRSRIVTEKLAAVMIQIVLMNAVVFALSALSIGIVGEEAAFKEIGLLHLAYFLVQTELAGICLGISAFLRRSGLGIGMGLAIGTYFLNLIANISESAEFLKYITPFGYTDGAQIIAAASLDGSMVGLGMCLAAAGIAAAYGKYCRKDIR